MKIETMISTLKAFNKPSREVCLYKLSRNYSIKNVTVEEVLEYAQAGHTIVPTVHDLKENTLKIENYISQQLFLVDIDENNLSMGDIVAAAYEVDLDVAMVYESFSSKEGDRRYRVGFIADRLITDLETRNRVNRALVEIMGADMQATDAGRLYFGTSYQTGWVNPEITPFNVERVASLASEVLVKEKASKGTQKAPKASKGSGGRTTAIVEAIVSMDKVKFVEELKNNALSEGYDIDWLFQEEVGMLDPYKALHKLPMTILSGVQDEGLFNCIMPDHEDNNPSANIYKTDDCQTYKCFGCCSSALDGFAFVELLTGSRAKAIKLLESTTSLRFSNMHYRGKKLLKYLQSKKFIQSYPNLSKILNKTLVTLTYFLSLADEKGSKTLTLDDRIGFFGSNRHIACQAGVSHTTIGNHKNYLVTIGLIEKLSSNEINKDVLARGKEEQQLNKTDKRIDYFAFPKEYNFDNMENIAAYMLKKGLTPARMSRVTVEQVLSQGIADKVYVQDAEAGNEATDIDLEKQEIVSKIAFEMLESKGYFVTKEILQEVRFNRVSISEVELTKILMVLASTEEIERGTKKDIREHFEVEAELVNSVVEAHHRTIIYYDALAVEGLLEEAAFSEEEIEVRAEVVELDSVELSVKEDVSVEMKLVSEEEHSVLDELEVSIAEEIAHVQSDDLLEEIEIPVSEGIAVNELLTIEMLIVDPPHLESKKITTIDPLDTEEEAYLEELVSIPIANIITTKSSSPRRRGAPIFYDYYYLKEVDIERRHRRRVSSLERTTTRGRPRRSKALNSRKASSDYYSSYLSPAAA